MAADALSYLPRRVETLERRVDGHAQSLVDLQLKDATFTEQIGGLKTSTDALKGTMDKVLWGLIGLCITIAGSAYVIHPVGVT